MEAYLAERLGLAGKRFAEFFRELEGAFVERNTLLRQVALALLCREHVLMTGPPGTAKSRVASAVLGRILDESTGEPSLFTRQFTESTVQTDLVGPINFKTLMETGRTEHFTDEGMLGAVHAFLDEVFDGRDMLLRSTLNVLHERELKQGTTVTRGQIECALMTSNRYLSEILESSRETLLAFVDRIAFLSFVPKGFAAPESLERVLRAEVAGSKPRPLSATLSIQDLNALQSAVDAVFVPNWLCERLADFTRNFELELAAARRADPTFVPSRYLSTRTVVRLGRVLRAACVLDWALNGRERNLCAEQSDLAELRLSLLLSGPGPAELAVLEKSESDPREARQLAIMRTEHEIFERCLGKLKPPLPVGQQGTVSGALLAKTMPDKLGAQDTQALIACTRELATAATGGVLGADTATAHLEAAVHELTQRAFLSGLGHETEESLEGVANGLSSLADELERTHPGRRPVARWLRGRALEALIHVLDHAPLDLQRELSELAEPGVDPSKALALGEGRFERLARVGAAIQALRTAGASEHDQAEFDKTWQKAVSRVEDSLVDLWDQALRAAVATALERAKPGDLAGVLDGLAESLEKLEQAARRFGELGVAETALKERVLGPRIAPFIRAAFREFDATNRDAVAAEVERVLGTLRRYGLERTLAPDDLLTYCAEALLRAETTPARLADFEANFDGYRRLRASDERASVAFVLADVGLRVLPELTRAATEPDDVVAALGKRLGALPDPLRTRLGARDLERVERPLALLERFWARLSEDLPSDAPPALAKLSHSGFFTLTSDEAALARFALELRLLELLNLGVDTKPLAARIRALEEQSSSAVRAFGRQRADDVWKNVLGSTRRS